MITKTDNLPANNIADAQADQISSEILPKQPKHEPKLSRKSITAIKMVNAGIDPATALKMVNCKDNISHQAIAELKEKVRKHSLSEPSVVKSAQSQLKRILKARAREEVRKKVLTSGEVLEYTDNVYPTDSNILAAAAMVYDRYEPVKGQEAAQGSGNTYIDLSQYQVQINQSGGDPQAVEIIPPRDVVL